MVKGVSPITHELIKKKGYGILMRFVFQYKGKFDWLISKEVFEAYCRHIYAGLKREFQVAWSPKAFRITVETDPKKPRGWGGNFQQDAAGFHLELQLFGCPKKEQTFTLLQSLLDHTLTHEMLHGFVPFVEGNSCWTEGVVEFLTYWYHGNVQENLAVLEEEYKAITDPAYKQHKYGYLEGVRKMAALCAKDARVLHDVKRLVRECNRNETNHFKVYTRQDVVAYNPGFAAFFGPKCNHVPHTL